MRPNVRDAMEGELTGYEFKHKLNRVAAKNFPDMILELAADLDELFRQYGMGGEGMIHFRQARFLAKEASAHIDALLERLEYAEELVSLHHAKLESVRAEGLNGLEGVASLTVDDHLDPHGYFVYVLWGEDDRPLYVGQSSNVVARIGHHMADQGKREATKVIQLIRCPDREKMTELERRLIGEYRPPHNTVHNPGPHPVAQLKE